LPKNPAVSGYRATAPIRSLIGQNGLLYCWQWLAVGSGLLYCWQWSAVSSEAVRMNLIRQMIFNECSKLPTAVLRHIAVLTNRFERY